MEKSREKRPPWQMPSLSTLPKADKSAMLRAKLLDASRRLRFGKIPVATQTDPITESGQSISTKLMKEVNIDVQRDLIEMKDAENLTDGSITLRQYNPGEFLLTHSVTQMTDEISSKTIETQTAAPALCGESFFDALRNSNILIRFQNIEKYLIQQNSLLNEKKERVQNLDKEILKLRPTNTMAKSKSVPMDIMKRTDLNKTYSHWNYELHDNGMFCRQPDSINEILPKQTTTATDIKINQKISKMLLSPAPIKKKLSHQAQPLNWDEIQLKLICNLIEEANLLIQLFEDISIAMGPTLDLNKIPEFEEVNMSYPSKKYIPIIEKFEKQAENILRQ